MASQKMAVKLRFNVIIAIWSSRPIIQGGHKLSPTITSPTMFLIFIIQASDHYATPSVPTYQILV